jgi:AP endonuclease-1
MPRRLSQKTQNKLAEIDSIEIITTPKKGRRTAKREVTPTLSKSPAKSTKKVKPELDDEDDALSGPSKTPTKVKINTVKAKAVLEKEQSSKNGSSKRKLKTEDDNEETNKKVTKKRKTKEEKEAENMPLAPRTLVGSLKKAMFIGAHVSGAGGMFY